MKTVKFFTLGCKVNQYDTQLIREQFIRAGFKEINNGGKADICVINTCTVTQRADSESFNLIHKAKRESLKAKIIVTGCLTELDGVRITETPGITCIIKNQDKNRILSLIKFPADNREPITENRGVSYFKGHTRAFLKIQDGCNNFCSYCKVPLVRGVSRSKPLNEIIQEARQLVKNGFKELVLCGICLGSFGKDLSPALNLVDVIEAIENIEGLLRIRLSSIEAGDICDKLINKMSQSEKLCRHLHIPLQSGDDEILRKMNRRYSGRDYLRLIKKIKSRVPGIAVTTDVLVGFPGESEINFTNTLDLIKKISPLKVHIFPYSPRGGTPAYNFKDKISPRIIKERILRLKNIAQVCALNFKKQFLNKTLEVLIEGRSKENPQTWEGYTDNYIKAGVKSKQNLKNQLITLKLKKINKNYVAADFYGIGKV